VIQNPSYYKREKLDTIRTAFYFESLDSYNRFINEVDSVAQGNARMAFDKYGDLERAKSRASKDWFGTDNPDLITKDISVYLFNNELDSFLQSFRNNTINVDIVDIDQNKAIKFTEKEIGIFSFDLASLGLIRVYEYYSPLLKKIIDGNLVRSRKSENGDLIFYHIYQPFIPKHYLKWDEEKNGYYSNILKRKVPVKDLVEEVTPNIEFYYPEREEIPEHEVERIQAKDANGKPKFSTTFKKSFVYIPKIEKPLPRIDLIVAANFNSNVDAEKEMIYASMSAITIAEKLSKSGVQYRIIAAYPVLSLKPSDRNNKEQYAFVVLKKEGEGLDKNKMAVLLSDGRYFRFQQFRGFVATQYDAGNDDRIDVIRLGRAILEGDKIKQAYIDMLLKSPNPEDQASANNPQSKIVFSGALTKRAAEDQYKQIIDIISKT
jgi:hypothetical protein